ncbi:PP2C family protein-serine/threonine phosphatase [Vogesella oryzae]|uniref:PP2C family protein-serine/threonine phosphatase n=1 Tax=Vogesella oryzae TaxID=1735285 RepID=UPI0015833C7F|nr:protein phosphatase 2C domain-containing protein [Vogesella oryzae]
MKFAIAAESRVGGREHNEDRQGAIWSAQSLLLVVADGMGGREYGEVAAQVAVDVFMENFRRSAHPQLLRPIPFLQRVMLEAHEAILAQSLQNRLHEIPSTTLVAGLVQGGHLYVVHAGDSRLYLLQGDRLRYRTRDHSQVQRLIDSGQLSEKDAQDYPGRNHIYNCLGATIDPEIEVSEPIPLQGNETLLLCSDGLWGPLLDEEISRIFNGREPQLVLPALMNVVERRAGAGCDNLSGIAVTLLGDNDFAAARDGYIDSERVSRAGFDQLSQHHP